MSSNWVVLADGSTVPRTSRAARAVQATADRAGKKYTVIGIQDEDTVEVVGVFAGHHNELSEALPDTWVQHVEAADPVAAHIAGLDAQLMARA